ncbi:MAG: hypothetical protein HY978_02545 [Candidatus Liptonbacteria bacterium]|nr:hypothetical protein [Candidatus Liptonbacteria bacterium]
MKPDSITFVKEYSGVDSERLRRLSFPKREARAYSLLRTLLAAKSKRRASLQDNVFYALNFLAFHLNLEDREASQFLDALPGLGSVSEQKSGQIIGYKITDRKALETRLAEIRELAKAASALPAAESEPNHLLPPEDKPKLDRNEQWNFIDRQRKFRSDLKLLPDGERMDFSPAEVLTWNNWRLYNYLWEKHGDKPFKTKDVKLPPGEPEGLLQRQRRLATFRQRCCLKVLPPSGGSETQYQLIPPSAHREVACARFFRSHPISSERDNLHILFAPESAPPKLNLLSDLSENAQAVYRFLCQEHAQTIFWPNRVVFPAQLASLGKNSRSTILSELEKNNFLERGFALDLSGGYYFYRVRSGPGKLQSAEAV